MTTRARSIRPTPSYRATLETLYGLKRFGMRPGLEVVRALLAELGHPERAYRSIHVTGSKGKGSVCAFADAILRASGRRVGLFTSPHLVSYRERIRVDGRPIPKPRVAEGVARVQALVERMTAGGRLERPPTFFEITTVLALDWFRECEVDAAVVEVGIGGGLDATNVLDSAVGVITTIELEHTDVLGPTLSHIAREKVGILHPGMRAVVGELPAEAAEVVRSVARTEGVPTERLGAEIRIGERSLREDGQSVAITTAGHPAIEIDLPLLGRFQCTNAALAIASAREFARGSGPPVDDDAVRRGLAGVRWPGRLQRVGHRPTAFLDVAHTPESARAVVESLAEIAPFNDPSESLIVFGCLADKPAEQILARLSPIADTLVVVPVRSARSADPRELGRIAKGTFRKVVQAPSASLGYELARAGVGPDGLLLVLGSDYLVGEILRSVDGADEDEPDLSDPGLAPDPAPPKAAR